MASPPIVRARCDTMRLAKPITPDDRARRHEAAMMNTGGSTALTDVASVAPVG